ncbi:hypothetical protein, partial [Flavobacterium sp.]|uniref:hypothetical protein n=1 Tax=Flavobacterium sp. TaxID=239 RepID=UPI0025C18419
GGTLKNGSLFDYIKKQNPKINIVRSPIQISANDYRYALSFNTSIYSNYENFLLLAIKKNELQHLINLTEASTPSVLEDFSDYHIKMLKLIQQAPISKDIDGKIYFRYKLVVSGLDKNGNYKETPENLGIDIFSKDGQLFSSDSYAQNIHIAEAGFMINFRRRDNYNEKGGHYGFDWMRPEFIAESDISNPLTPGTKTGRDGICIANIDTVTKSEAQEQLKHAYTPLVIKGYNYYVPWLSLYENHETVIANGNPINPKEHEVWLSMELDNRLTSNTGLVRFEIPQGIEAIFRKGSKVIIPPLKVSELRSITMVIKCHEKSNLDRKIYAYDENNNLVGALNILKNNETFKCDVRFVKVNLAGTLTGKDVSQSTTIVDHKINYTTRTSENYLNNILAGTNASLNLNGNFKDWEKKIKNSEKNAIYLFRQSLIKYNPIKLGNGDIDFSRQITVNFGNHIIGTQLPDTTLLNRFKNKLLGIQADGTLIINDETEESLIEFINIIDSMYIDSHPDNNDSVTVFVFPCNVICKFEPNTTAASNGVENAKCVLLMRRELLDKDKTLSHEISHSLGLVHTFQTGLLDIHSFLQYHTENIMDYIYPIPNINNPLPEPQPKPTYLFKYSEYGISYFKWQIEKMKQDPDLKIES